MQNQTLEVCLDYQGICRKALGTLRRRAVTEYIEAEELLSVGALALCEKRPATEALGVKIARDAMIDATRKHRRREQGRVWPTAEDAAEDDDTDALDTLLSSGGGKLKPETAHVDLWEAMRALPAREYRAVSLHFWGGKSQAEIAEELGLNQSTVSRIMESAKKMIADCIKLDAHTVISVGGKETRRTVLSGRKGAA